MDKLALLWSEAQFPLYLLIESGCIVQYHFLGWENCGTILVPHYGDTTLYSHTIWFHNFPSPESHTTLQRVAIQCSITFWAGKIVEPFWFHILVILHCIATMWNHIGSTIFPAQGKWFHKWNHGGSTWFSIELSMNWENGSTNWNQS